MLLSTFRAQGEQASRGVRETAETMPDRGVNPSRDPRFVSIQVGSCTAVLAQQWLDNGDVCRLVIWMRFNFMFLKHIHRCVNYTLLSFHNKISPMCSNHESWWFYAACSNPALINKILLSLFMSDVAYEMRNTPWHYSKCQLNPVSDMAINIKRSPPNVTKTLQLERQV